jgi:cytochrome c oxidase cbb3-type subunit 3
LRSPNTAMIALVVIFSALGFFGGILLTAGSAAGQSPQTDRRQDRSPSAHPAFGVGDKAFAASCSGCHGLDGRGSERAPNIADRPKVQHLSDSQIFRIIENGIPGTGMPAFHSLESSQIKALVIYLRTLQGTKRTKKTIELPGDPQHGETIFFGKAGCSHCHALAGQGGFIASDLAAYASTRAAEEIRSAIIEPTASSDRPVRLATATTRGGEKYVGRVRNEDNFSLQLQTLDGTFHFVSKSDLATLEYDSKTLMPSDYGSKLSPDELNDVVSYLIGASASKPEVPRKNHDAH